MNTLSSARVEDAGNSTTTYDKVPFGGAERFAVFNRLNMRAKQTFELPGLDFWQKHIVDPYPHHPHVLDAGCGSGAFLEHLGKFLWQTHKRPATLYGVDSARDFINWAGRVVDASGIMPSYRHGDFLDVASFGSWRFDVVHISQAIFGENRDLKSSLVKVGKLLKQGGRLIIQEPNLDEFTIQTDQMEFASRWEEMKRRMQQNCVRKWGSPQGGGKIIEILKELGFQEVCDTKISIPSDGLSLGCGFFASFETFLPLEERANGLDLIKNAEALGYHASRSRSFLTAVRA